MGTIQSLYLELTSAEADQIEAVLSEVMGGRDSQDLLTLLNTASVLAQEVPRRIRSAMYEFKSRETADVVCIRTKMIDDRTLGPTPLAHRSPGEGEDANRQEAMHVLFASLLGEPFAWTSIQNGYIINDIIPVPEHREQIASSGSDVLFDFHTEDAFHPEAGDYLGLMCLRNPDRVGTVFSKVNSGDLSDKVVDELFKPHYIVGANLAQHVLAVTQPSPIFFGNRVVPYIRVNLNATRAIEGHDEADAALDELQSALRANATQMVLESGDCCYIDNYRVAHARDAYSPRFDGTDRWLKRLYISSAMRRTAALRAGTDGRIINPGVSGWRWVFQ